MSSRQKIVNPTTPDGQRMAAEGFGVTLQPATLMNTLFWVELPKEYDRITIEVVKFELTTSGVVPVFPGMAFWSLRRGIGCAFDEEVPIADVVTNFTGKVDLESRHGYLVTAQGFPADSYELVGALQPSMVCPVVVTIKVSCAFGGNTTPVVTLGTATG